MARTEKKLVPLVSPLLALWLLATPISHAEPAKTAVASKAKPRYTLTAGRGWSVCEAYVKSLNALAASGGPPLCEMKFTAKSGISEPDWEELDVTAHLPVVHQMELMFGIGFIEPTPLQDFELWKEQRLRRVSAYDQKPVLRRARRSLVPDGPIETILSYQLDAKYCDEKAAGLNRKPYSGTLGVPVFFMLNEAKGRLWGGRGWMVSATGVLRQYRHGMFLFTPYLDGEPSPGFEEPDSLTTLIYVTRLETSPLSAEQRRVNEPPYWFHEICTVEYRRPIAEIRY